MSSERRRTGALVAAILGVTLAGCSHREVVPAELARLGPGQSATWMARAVYPGSPEAVVIVRPSLGDPALLVPEADTFGLTFWIAPGEAGEAVVFEARPDPDDPAIGVPVELLATPTCDADRLCRTRARADASLSTGEPWALCATSPSGRSCRPRALAWFDAVPDPLRVAVVTDLHLGGFTDLATGRERLRRVLSRVASADPPLQVAIVLGDLSHGGEPEQIAAFAAEAEASSVPLIVVPGNHDYEAGRIETYLRQVTPHLDHATRLGPYRLVGLDSGPQWTDQGGSFTHGTRSLGLLDAQVDWLAEALAPDADAAAPAALVLLHYPPYGLTGSVLGQNRDRLLARCREAGVGLVLAGHTHTSEVYDREGVAAGLSPRCGEAPPRRRWPLTLATPRSLDTGPSFREVTLRRDGSFSYCLRDVP